MAFCVSNQSTENEIISLNIVATYGSINDNGVFRYGRGVEVGELDCVCRQGGQV